MLLISFGTRPEYIKIKPIIAACQKHDVKYRMLFTGQHEDLLSHLDHNNLERMLIKGDTNRLDALVSSILTPNNCVAFEDTTHVLVQGDTTSAFAVGLAAFHRKLKVVHLEAGLRTYDLDNPYPEEFNRQALSRLAMVHLCPTETAAANLRREKVAGSVYVVGNTVLDNLVEVVPKRTNKVVVTMHRRENHSEIEEWFTTFETLATQHPDLEFVLPIHPNPNVIKHQGLLKNVKAVDAMKYEEFIKLLSESHLVITDSGGLQEESSFFRKRCIVCRKTTERGEGMGVFATLCGEPSQLSSIFKEINKNPIPDPAEECPYGDGRSSERIIEILTQEGL